MGPPARLHWVAEAGGPARSELNAISKDVVHAEHDEEYSYPSPTHPSSRRWCCRRLYQRAAYRRKYVRLVVLATGPRRVETRSLEELQKSFSQEKTTKCPMQSPVPSLPILPTR